VVAGTVVTDSAIRARVEAVGEQTALAGIRRLVEQAQSSRSRAQALADRAAALLFYFAAGAGLVTMAVWLLLGEPDQAIERTVTVLVIACPHALGWRSPWSSPSRPRWRPQRHPGQGPAGPGADADRRRGAVRQDRHADHGQSRRSAEWPRSDGDTAGLLRLAGRSRPTASIPWPRRSWPSRPAAGGDPPRASDFRSHDRPRGPGPRSRAHGGRRRPGPAARAGRARARGAGQRDRRLAGPRGHGAVRGPRGQGAGGAGPRGRRAARVTPGRRATAPAGQAGGDDHRRRRQVAEAVAAELGVDEVFAEVLARGQGRGRGRPATPRPVGGHGRRRRQRRPRPWPGPTSAWPSAAGTDVAIESAGVVLSATTRAASSGCSGCRGPATARCCRTSAWATGYNLLAVPVAAGVLAWPASRWPRRSARS
jgi:Cu2+-exporting ATPase